MLCRLEDESGYLRMKAEEDTHHARQNHTQNQIISIEQEQAQQKTSSEKVKVLILGGTGEMGQWFTRFFKERAYQVTVWGKGGKMEIARKMEVPFASDLEAVIPESD